MKAPATLLGLALSLLSSAASAQDMSRMLKPSADLFLVASADPLTQRILRAQAAGPSGGVVSAVLRRPAGGDLAAAQIDYQGAPADGLALPAQAIASGLRASAPASDLRDAVGSSSPVKPVSARQNRRGVAVSELISVMDKMGRGQNRAVADKAWERKPRSRSR